MRPPTSQPSPPSSLPDSPVSWWSMFLLCLYFVLLPIHWPIADFNVSLGDPLIAVLFPFCLYRIRYRLWHSKMVRTAVWFWLIVILLSVLTAGLRPGESDMAIARELLKLTAVLAAFFVSLSLFLDVRGRYSLPFAVSILVCVTMTLLAVLGMLRSAYGSARLTGTFPNPNMFANYVVFCIIFAIGMFLAATKTRIRVISLILLVSTGMGLLFSGSRGGVVGLVLGMAYFSLQIIRDSRAKLRRWYLALVILAAIALTTIVIVRWEDFSLVERTTRTLTDNEDLNISKRFYLLESARQFFFESPLIGIGYGTFADRVGKPTHNVYASYLAETGVIGGATLIWFILSPLVRLRRPRGTVPDIWLVAAQSFWVCCWVQGFTNNVDQWRTGWVCLALIAAAELRMPELLPYRMPPDIRSVPPRPVFAREDGAGDPAPRSSAS